MLAGIVTGSAVGIAVHFVIFGFQHDAAAGMGINMGRPIGGIYLPKGIDMVIRVFGALGQVAGTAMGGRFAVCHRKGVACRGIDLSAGCNLAADLAVVVVSVLVVTFMV